MIKRHLVDAGLGLLLFFLVMVVEFLVNLPYGSPAADADLWGPLNRELLLTAGPALAVSGLLAFGSHTRSWRQGLRRGVTWALVLGVLYLVIGLGNGTAVMFATWGLWLTLMAVLVGAVAGGWLGGRRLSHEPGNDSAALRTRVR